MFYIGYYRTFDSRQREKRKAKLFIFAYYDDIWKENYNYMSMKKRRRGGGERGGGNKKGTKTNGWVDIKSVLEESLQMRKMK